jgi:hypothetical protein
MLHQQLRIQPGALRQEDVQKAAPFLRCPRGDFAQLG